MEHIVRQDAGVGDNDALGGRMADVALMPESDVFHGSDGKTPQYTGQATNALAKFRIAFVRHSGRPLLARSKWLKCFAYLGAL